MRKSPHFAGILRGHQPEFEPWRLGGGVRSRVRTGLQAENRELLLNFGRKQAPRGFHRLLSSNSNVISVGYTVVKALSCYSAKQAFVACDQATVCAISEILSLKPANNEFAESIVVYLTFLPDI